MNFLVYKITNKINNKIYIGKTKEYNKDKYFGIEGRFKNHLRFAKSGAKHCPKLYNAIRKHGEENFMIELIETTTEDDIDNKEIYHIKEFNSTHNDIGYNIALGGGGRSVVNVDDIVRTKISKAQSSNGEMNVKPVLNDEKQLIGYFSRRRENGKVFQKYFTSTKFSPDENLIKAREWVNDIKNNKNDISLKYNKSNNLPTNISHVKDKNDKTIIIGYNLHIMKDGVKYSKSFQSKTGNLEELLNKAIQKKNEILNA